MCTDSGTPGPCFCPSLTLILKEIFLVFHAKAVSRMRTLIRACAKSFSLFVSDGCSRSSSGFEPKLEARCFPCLLSKGLSRSRSEFEFRTEAKCVPRMLPKGFPISQSGSERVPIAKAFSKIGLSICSLT